MNNFGDVMSDLWELTLSSFFGRLKTLLRNLRGHAHRCVEVFAITKNKPKSIQLFN